MTTKQFWAAFASAWVMFLILAVLLSALVFAFLKPRECQIIQTHQNRSVSQCI